MTTWLGHELKDYLSIKGSVKYNLFIDNVSLDRMNVDVSLGSKPDKPFQVG